MPRSADDPRLSVVSPKTASQVPADDAASEGLERLARAAEKPDADLPATVGPPAEIVVRASTAPPPPRRIPAR